MNMLNVMDVGSVVILACFVWTIWRTAHKPSRSNIWLMTILAVVVRLDGGFAIASRLYIPVLRSILGSALSSVENDQLLTSTVSAAALTKLEDGKDSEAKSLLAMVLANSYRQLKDAKTLNAQQQKALAHIEELRSKSETLRQKLLVPTNKQP